MSIVNPAFNPGQKVRQGLPGGKRVDSKIRSINRKLLAREISPNSAVKPRDFRAAFVVDSNSYQLVVRPDYNYQNVYPTDLVEALQPVANPLFADTAARIAGKKEEDPEVNTEAKEEGEEEEVVVSSQIAHTGAEDTLAVVEEVDISDYSKGTASDDCEEVSEYTPFPGGTAPWLPQSSSASSSQPPPPPPGGHSLKRRLPH